MLTNRSLIPRSVIGAGLALVLGLGAQVVLTGSPAAAATAFTVSTTADVAANAGACGNAGIVTPPSPLSLREAVCLANNNGSTSTISIPAGTYNLTNGQLKVGLFSGQNVTLDGASAATTVIDAGGNSRVLDFDDGLVGGITGTVSDLTIKGGADTDFGGAGIIAGSANAPTRDVLTITNSVITGNNANNSAPTVTNRPGGGVQFIGGQLTISNSTISNNGSKSSPGSGVAYSATGTTASESLTITGSTFSGNSATNTNGTAATNGGALDVRAPVTATMSVTDSRFINNTVAATTGGAVGAAIRQESGTLSVSRSTFTGNSVSGGALTPAGGAIEVTTGAATLNYNRFFGNSATSGSALHVGSGAGAIDATRNWWGCSAGPGGTGCDTVVAVSPGSASVTPRLVLTASATPATVVGPSGTATIVGSLTTDSANGAVTPANLTAFAALPVTFTDPLPSGATVTPGSVNIASGAASATYNSQTTSGAGHVLVGLDNATATVPVTVNRGPAVTTNPSSQSVNAGDLVTFTAAANGFPTPTVQWQRDTGSGFTNIAGATSTTYSFTAAAGDNGNQYRAVFTNSVSSAVTTAADLSVGQPPAFTSGDTATFVVGNPGSFSITTSGVPTVTSISKTGALPSGVTFTDNGNGTATISGTPAAGTGGTYPVSLVAVNGVLPNGSQSFTVVVNQGPAITTNPSDQTVNPGTSVTFSAAATGVPTPTVQWQVDTGSGYSNIAGATSTSYAFTAAAGNNGNKYRAVFTNVAGSVTTSAATLHVGSAPAFTSNNATTFTVDTAGSYDVTSSGVPNATITATGTLPAWLTLIDNGNGSGSLGGTPTVGSGGTYTFTLHAANGFDPDASQTFTLSVNERPTITSANQATFTVGSAGTFSVTTTAGFPTATSITKTGSLPSGVTLMDNGDGTATIGGTPAAGTSGSYPIVIQAQAVGGTTAATQNFTLDVNGPPSISSADHATFSVGSAGSFTVTTTTGRPASTTLTETGALPAGVTFTDNNDGTATLSGTPAANTGGSYNLSLKASNGISPDDMQPFTLTVNQPPAITSANHVTFALGVAAAFTVTTSPGVPAATTITKTGALPPGTTLVDIGDGTATLGGTPTSQGVYTFTITAANGVSPDASQTFTATVTSPPSITSADHTTFAVGTAGSFTVTTTAGQPATTTLTKTGALPGGVTFVDNGNGTATLGGTPASGTEGSYSLTIKASNGVVPDTTQAFTLTVTQNPSITSADHATFDVGAAGTFTVTTSAGFPTATTLTKTGALPGGVTFFDNGDGTATLSGTPAVGTGGAYPITLRASNTSGNSDQSFTLTVREPAHITSADHATFATGTSGSFTVTTTPGFPTAITLTKTGALPGGVTFVDNGDGTAKLAGTPAAGSGGSYPITVVASNGGTTADTQSFVLTVNQAPVITSADHATFTFGSAGSFQIGATGYPVPVVAHTGALPGGVTFVDNGDGTATLAGTPGAGSAGSYPLTITADSVAGHAQQSFSLTVARAGQSVQITSTPPVPALVGGTYALTATSSSGLAVSLSVDAATTASACSLTGSTVHLDHAGTCVIDANQAGNANYAPAAQDQQSFAVATVAATVTITDPTPTTVFGQEAHVTADVTAGGTSPAGAIQFKVDGADLGAPVTVAAGHASSPALTAADGSPLAPGSHTVLAVFTPSDPTTYSSAQDDATHVVDKASTALDLAVDSTTITATASAVAPGAGTPGGTVVFTVDGSTVGSAPLVGGLATLSYVVPPGAARQVAATYDGDADFDGSTSSITRQDPSITASVSSRHPRHLYGWYRSPVNVRFTCTANGSPLTGPCPDPVVLDHNGTNRSVTRSISAADGGTSTVVVDGINIDMNRPSLRVAGVHDGAVYDTHPQLSCVAHDGLSGVRKCKLTQRHHGHLFTYKAAAVDFAGNRHVIRGSYHVR
ncbi:putative Ig domain-containing protein [Nocardioides sp.]|uniref:beta strand repeat-containing protein n=1 Tax=Nocardioides sp. TaxID=35761 RepID=UPI0031FF3542|nr:hypothetical protein [Nocardioides sp.]